MSTGAWRVATPGAGRTAAASAGAVMVKQSARPINAMNVRRCHIPIASRGPRISGRGPLSTPPSGAGVWEPRPSKLQRPDSGQAGARSSEAGLPELRPLAHSISCISFHFHRDKDRYGQARPPR